MQLFFTFEINLAQPDAFFGSKNNFIMFTIGKILKNNTNYKVYKKIIQTSRKKGSKK